MHKEVISESNWSFILRLQYCSCLKSYYWLCEWNNSFCPLLPLSACLSLAVSLSPCLSVNKSILFFNAMPINVVFRSACESPVSAQKFLQASKLWYKLHKVLQVSSFIYLVSAFTDFVRKVASTVDFFLGSVSDLRITGLGSGSGIIFT